MSKDPGAKPDETPATPTETEIRSALEGLKNSSLSQQRVAKAAKLLLDYHPVLADHMEPKDLINDAVLAILDGRRDWDRSRADFPTFLIGVMRSLAYNETRKALETRPRYVRELLRMEGKQFWTIDRRIARTFEAAAKRRRNYDD